MGGFDWTAARKQISGNLGYMGQTITIGETVYPASISVVPTELIMQEGFHKRVEFDVLVSRADMEFAPASQAAVTYNGVIYKVKGAPTPDELNYKFTIYKIG